MSPVFEPAWFRVYLNGVELVATGPDWVSSASPDFYQRRYIRIHEVKPPRRLRASRYILKGGIRK